MTNRGGTGAFVGFTEGTGSDELENCNDMELLFEGYDIGDGRAPYEYVVGHYANDPAGSSSE